MSFLDGPVTIVGVMPPAYQYPGRWAELWTPLASAAAASPASRARLERRDLRTGIATLCIGAGMGVATIVERV